MWSTIGSAATWPSWTPALTKVGGTSSPAFRTSPGSGLVFVAGTLAYPLNTGNSVTLILSDTPAPAAFRPAQTFALDSSGYYVLDTAGNLVWNPGGAAAQGGGSHSFRTFYFSDTPTP